MPTSSRPISDGAISDDGEEADSQQGVFLRQYRVRLRRDRYPGIAPSDNPAMAAPPAAPTPTYDSLNPDQRSAVNRMIVAVRLSNMRGDA